MNHDETFGEAMLRLADEAKALDAHGLLAQIDQLEASVRHRRDEILYPEAMFPIL